MRARTEPLVWVLWSAAMASVYAATTTTRLPTNDVLSASLAAWRIATSGSPWFDDFPLDQVDVKPGQVLWSGTTSHGHVAIFRSPGAIAVGLPAYLVRGGGSDVSDFSLLPAAFTTVALTVAALVLLALALRPTLGGVRSLVAVTALGLGSPVWTVNAESMWPHTLTVLAIAGMAWAASREHWVLVGIFGGVGLWGRLHVCVIVALLGLLVAVWRRTPTIVLRVGIPSAALMGLAAAWSRWMYGEWDPAGGYPTVTEYAQTATGASALDQLLNELGLWISPGRGLLVVTPVVLVLLPAVRRAWPTLPDWVRALLVGGISYAVVQGLLNHFGGGTGFYGYRLTLETLVSLFPALVLSLGHAGRLSRMLVPALLAAQVAAFAFGALRDAFSVENDDAWRVNSVLSAVSTVPSFAAVLVLAGLVGLLLHRVAPTAWGWPRTPSGAEEPHERA